MAVIDAKFVFSPAVPGVSVSAPLAVTGDSLSEVKQKVLASLAQKKQTAQGQVSAIETAENSFDQ